VSQRAELSAISFGVFCRLHPSTSAISRSGKSFAWLRADLHDDLIGQHSVPPVTNEVATRFDQRITGADSPGSPLVDRGNPLDHVGRRRDEWPESTTQAVASCNCVRRPFA